MFDGNDSGFFFRSLRAPKKPKNAVFVPMLFFYVFLHGGTTYDFPCFLHVFIVFCGCFLLSWLLLVECCICCFHFP